MKKQNLRSEEAIKRWLKLKGWKMVYYQKATAPNILNLIGHVDKRVELIAKIDLRELIKKRQPLTGIKKQMSAIVSGKKAKKVKK